MVMIEFAIEVLVSSFSQTAFKLTTLTVYPRGLKRSLRSIEFTVTMISVGDKADKCTVCEKDIFR